MADITSQELLHALTEQLSVIADSMATKEDLREFRVDLEGKIKNSENRLGKRVDTLELRLGRRVDAIAAKFIV